MELYMGMVAYMSLFDSNNNQITGGSQVPDRYGSMEIKKINYTLSRGFDNQTGKQHNTRRHQPFSILKPIDCSTPSLFQCCASGKLLSHAKIDLYKPNDEGRETNYFSYILENARIISVTPMIDASSSESDMEAISFSFEKITLAYHEGNLIAVDSWEQR
jgi:type VI secretion system secreted protein Hcp